MARIRSVKPEFWTNSTTGKLSGAATKLYLGLHNHSDDYGVGRFEPDELRVKILPYEKGGNRSLERAVAELELAGADENPYGLLVRFRASGKRFYWLPYFTKHQRVDHRGDPLLDGWDVATNPDGYANTENETGTLQEPNGNDPAGVERRGEEKHMSSGAVETVWAEYLDHHPQAKPLAQRLDLIKRRLRDYPTETLKAAIIGNHRDPFCNGENEHRRPYHSLELILRDADHIEKYAALALDGNGNGHQKVLTVEDLEEMARIRAATPGYVEPTEEEYDRFRATEEEMPY